MIHLLAFLLILLAPAVSDAAARRIQGCTNHNLAVDNTATCTLAAPSAVGNTLLIGAGSGNSARVLNTIATTSGTCAIDTAKLAVVAGAIYVGSCAITTAGTQAITVTWDALLNAFLVVEEYTGIEATSFFDATGTGTAATSPCTATSAVTTSATELVFGFCELVVASTATAGSGCTLQTQFNPASGDSWITLDKNVTAVGAQTCSATMTDTNWQMIVATYRTSSGYILTQGSDCINAETSDRLISEDATAGTGPCAAAAGTTPERTKMGVGT